jgi:hypothetical protein
VRLEPMAGIRPVAFIPPSPVPTELARGLLPATVPHADAAGNAGRAALLVAALTARPDALLDATEDRLHQDYRAPAMPGTHDLVRRLRSAGVPAVVSGAGPAVLAFLTGQAGVTDLETLGSIARETGMGWRISPLDVERRGASAAPGVRVPGDAGPSSSGRLTPFFRDMDGCEGMRWALSVLGWVQHRSLRYGAGAGHPRLAWAVTYTCPGVGFLPSPQESSTFP